MIALDPSFPPLRIPPASRGVSSLNLERREKVGELASKFTRANSPSPAATRFAEGGGVQLFNKWRPPRAQSPSDRVTLTAERAEIGTISLNDNKCSWRWTGVFRRQARESWSEFLPGPPLLVEKGCFQKAFPRVRTRRSPFESIRETTIPWLELDRHFLSSCRFAGRSVTFDIPEIPALEKRNERVCMQYYVRVDRERKRKKERERMSYGRTFWKHPELLRAEDTCR